MNTLATPTAALRELRDRLLALHRELIASERAVFERSAGPIPTPAAFLHLLAHDPWFDWLRPLSRKIAEIDALLADEKRAPITRAALDSQRGGILRLVTPDEHRPGPPRAHFEAIQRDPAVAFAHARLRSHLAAAG